MISSGGWEDFRCYGNHLETLKGGPREVGGSYQAWNNPFESLEGAPVVYSGLYWSERGKMYGVPPIENSIDLGSILAWDIYIYHKEDRSEKLSEYIKRDPSSIEYLNIYFGREWFTPSPYALAIYKAIQRGL